mmetsp:Transcript_75925/g.220461  ORF Transcript_75925/g.220461 Transcript_75925/m.220461 type:complete len:205 (+) Transcript_75925:753-1367(+)
MLLCDRCRKTARAPPRAGRLVGWIARRSRTTAPWRRSRAWRRTRRIALVATPVAMNTPVLSATPAPRQQRGQRRRHGGVSGLRRTTSKRVLLAVAGGAENAHRHPWSACCLGVRLWSAAREGPPPTSGCLARRPRLCERPPARRGHCARRQHRRHRAAPPTARGIARAATALAARNRGVRRHRLEAAQMQTGVCRPTLRMCSLV